MKVELTLPTLHVDQVRAFKQRTRFQAIRAGRRWGKTDYAKTLVGDGVSRGQSYGWFAPNYKISSEAFSEMSAMLEPILSQANSTSGVMRTTTKGRIDFWTMENELAGRSRKYHGIVIDEAAFTKPNAMKIWQQAIEPTLLDYKGWALVMSNANGIDVENFFWRICNEPEHGFTEYHAPTSANPYMPKEEIERLKRDRPPLVFQQEYLAEFIDWSGVAFFALNSLLVNNQPVPMPVRCDAVYATIDTATKTGKENDGTAIIYWALDKHSATPLFILDYDIQQIEGALLETWLPVVFKNLEAFAAQCGARSGSIGAWIEDKASGMVLIQQSARRGWPARAIDSKLTSVGKSERAISVSGYVYREMIKLTEQAFNHVTSYKSVSRNHLLSQVLAFRVGNKDQIDDDLLDCFTYGIAIALGDAGGF